MTAYAFFPFLAYFPLFKKQQKTHSLP